MGLDSFKNVNNKMCLQIIYSIDKYKVDLALNNLQWFVCHKTKHNQIIYLIYMHKEALALNNLQWLICHKTEQNQIMYFIYICIKSIWH